MYQGHPEISRPSASCCTQSVVSSHSVIGLCSNNLDDKWHFFKSVYHSDLAGCPADSTKDKLQNMKDGPGSVLYFQITRKIISLNQFKVYQRVGNFLFILFVGFLFNREKKTVF